MSVIAEAEEGRRRANGAAGGAVTSPARLILLWVALSASSDLFAAEQIPAGYAPYGELILARLNSAPFPHPDRARGHRYKEQEFSAAEHYSDNTVAIFIPKNFRPTTSLDFVVHFHGWHNNVTNVLSRYH